MNQPEMRRKLVQMSMDRTDVLVVESGQEVLRNGDANYRFRANSDFLYLTGITEPNSALIITMNSQILLVRPKDSKQEMWHGARLGITQSRKQTGIDSVYNIENSSYKVAYKTTKGMLDIVHQMRSVKDSIEIQNMCISADIAMTAHHRAMRMSTFKESENSIQAIFDGKFTSAGVEHSYTPIVAGGVNALCLHYIANNQKLEAGTMLLIDAGCEYEGYASDITRTFPVDGKFGTQEADIYQVVLEANKEAIKLVSPGVTMSDIDSLAREIITQGMKSLGFKSKNGYFPHGTGHFLGLDVHDVGDRHAPLEVGNVITVEPGAYVKELGLGIRIEDDILVTVDGNINLTEGLAKEISEIEEVILCPLT